MYQQITTMDMSLIDAIPISISTILSRGKKLLFIFIGCIIPLISTAMDYDSLMYSDEQIIELEERIELLEEKISNIKSDRSFISVTTTVIAGIFAIVTILIAALIGFMVPRGLRRDFDTLRSDFEKLKESTQDKGEAAERFKEMEDRILAISALANRTMYGIALDKYNYMMVIWLGRWFRYLVQQYEKNPNDNLLNDMITILSNAQVEWKNIYDSENNQKQLIMFKGFQQVKEDFQALERFNNEDIKVFAGFILAKLYEIEEKYRDFEPPFSFPTVTPEI